jgi:hypothetical protein
MVRSGDLKLGVLPWRDRDATRRPSPKNRKSELPSGDVLVSRAAVSAIVHHRRR